MADPGQPSLVGPATILTDHPLRPRRRPLLRSAGVPSTIERSRRGATRQRGSAKPVAQAILVAEDDPPTRSLIRTLISRAGYRVVEAANGRIALHLVAQETPDLVLLDVRMPALDGIEVTRRLRAEAATGLLPISLVTGLPKPSRRSQQNPMQSVSLATSTTEPPCPNNGEHAAKRDDPKT